MCSDDYVGILSMQLDVDTPIGEFTEDHGRAPIDVLWGVDTTRCVLEPGKKVV